MSKKEIRPTRNGVHYRMSVLMPCKLSGIVDLLRAAADNLVRLNERFPPGNDVKEKLIHQEREEMSRLLFSTAMNMLERSKVLWGEYDAERKQVDAHASIDTFEEEWSECAEERHEED